jgi:hypothetical protein
VVNRWGWTVLAFVCVVMFVSAVANGYGWSAMTGWATAAIAVSALAVDDWAGPAVPLKPPHGSGRCS